MVMRYTMPRSVQLVARMNQPRNEIKCGDFCMCFFKQRIINRQERYLFRATSCTLRFWRGYKQRRLAWRCKDIM